jgi:hypothetical protein
VSSATKGKKDKHTMHLPNVIDRAGIQEIAPEEMELVVGGGNQKPPPPPPPSMVCWNNGHGGLACMSEGDVKIQ